ncbi:hypothetical protein [uncultured Thiodictyon sp.]|uniref:DUF7007 domain-containing protein n=1 Tax=uncultured Thiodictyon sp. TaxID=1846217 RepID=UPI0025F32AC6|nr:hypothetical protein [uncultured Thiodictyon sp.]
MYDFKTLPVQKMTKTPWGDGSGYVIAPGITLLSTESHGGIHVSVERLAEMPDVIRNLDPFAGSGWYEEDCDWALVAMAFPEHFSGEHCQAAITTVQRWNNEVNWDAYLTDTAQGRLCAKKASQTAASMQP